MEKIKTVLKRTLAAIDWVLQLSPLISGVLFGFALGVGITGGSLLLTLISIALIGRNFQLTYRG